MPDYCIFRDFVFVAVRGCGPNIMRVDQHMLKTEAAKIDVEATLRA